MDWANSERSSELLHAQAHVWNHIFNFINSMSLKCTCHSIRHPRHHPQPWQTHDSSWAGYWALSPPKKDSVRVSSHAHSCSIWLLFCAKSPTKWARRGVTNASRLLLKDDFFGIRPFLLAMLDPTLTKPWHYVSAWFQNDDPTAFHTAHERTLWDYAGPEPQLNNFFNEAMVSDARLVTSVLVKEGKGVFEGLNSLVDVGGCTGTMAKVIANAFPYLNCTVLDLPRVVAGLQGSKNLNYSAGDMFEAIPLADASLLKVCLSFSYQLLTFSGSQRMRKIFFKYVKNHFRKESQFEKNFQYFFFLLFYVRFKKQNQFVFLVRKLWFKYTKHYGSKGVPYEKESQFMVNKRKYWGKWDQTPKLHWPYLLFIHHVPYSWFYPSLPN